MEVTSTNDGLGEQVEGTAVLEGVQARLLFCRTHPEQSARVVAVVGIVLSPIWAIYSCLNVVFYEPKHATLAVLGASIVCSISVLAYSCILLAIGKRRPDYYIPFFLYNAYSIVSRSVCCGFILFILSSERTMEEMRKGHQLCQNKLVMVLVFCLVVNTVKLLLNVWFQLIVLIAHRRLRFQLQRDYSPQVDEC